MGLKHCKELRQQLDLAVNKGLDLIEQVGQQAVEVAKRNGTYHDVTGNLRRSNGFKMGTDTAVLYNSASYAAEVSARGEDVIDSATAYLKNQLSKETVI